MNGRAALAAAARVAGDRRGAARYGWYALVWLAALGALQLIWPTPPGVIVQGVILGSLSALVAFGLSLVYRANRVINFAQADLGVAPAALGVSLITAWNWPYVIVLPITLAGAVVLGAVVERTLIRPFSRAPRLILMVATIGLAQLLTGAAFAVPLLFDPGPGLAALNLTSRFESPFDFSIKIDPIVFTGNDVLAVLIVPLAVLGLVRFLNGTSLGTAVRASAESADRAALVGIDVGRTQNLVWVLATVLATVGMVLRAGIFGLPIGPALGPAILLRALAAAVMGRMENYAVMFAGATFLGIVETAVIWNENTPVLIDPALFVIVIGVLLFQRRQRRTRVEDQAATSWQDVRPVRRIPRELAALPEVVWGSRAAKLAGAAAVLVLPALLGDADTNLAGAVMVYAIIATSMVVLTGWSGEISLGQMAFVAIGAATAATLNHHYNWDLTLTLLAAGAVGALASVVIGLPALRIRGLFLTVTTLSFALATSSYLLNRDYFGFLPDNVSERVRRLPLLGRLDVTSEAAFYYVCAAVLFAVLWTIGQLRRTRTARVLVAVRDNEANAQAFGVNLTRTKLMAFAIAGFYASLAGGLFALHQQALGQQIFAPTESIRVLTMVVIGGLGSVPGAILGAVFLQGTEYFSDFLPRNARLFFVFATSGVGLLVVLRFVPGGLGQLLFSVRDRWLRSVASRRGLVVPSLFADSRPPDEEPRAAPSAGDGDGDGGDALLSVRSVDVSYGQVQVLFGVDLALREGEVIALLGTNGAGKSTVLRAVSGLATPGRGSIRFRGADITGMAPHRIAALGIAQVPGGKGVFPSLSVAENLRLGAWLRRRDAAHVAAATERVLQLFPVLREKIDEPAASLSGGQQQMLTLAMALMADPKLLLIDELSLGLAPVVVEELLAVVRRLNADGVTIVIVEQSVNVALTLARTAYFMEKGEIRFHGSTAGLLDRDDILRSVFLEGSAARHGTDPRPRRRPAGDGAPEAAVRLHVEDLRKSFHGNVAVDGVSFSLHEGEILGVIGPNGAGKTTVFELISGFQTPDHGLVVLEGRDITSLSPDLRSLLGLSRSFQDARLFGALTVEDVLKLSLDQTVPVHDPVAAVLGLPDVADAERRLQLEVDELVELMGLGAFRDKFVSELSTGSRRIVDLACQIAKAPRVILFDEPSSGIAQREAEALGPLLERIRDETGASLLVIEHDMPLLTGISDRIVALHLGAKVVEGTPDDVLHHPTVVASYLGSSPEAIARSGARSGQRRRPRRAMSGTP